MSRLTAAQVRALSILSDAPGLLPSVAPATVAALRERGLLSGGRLGGYRLTAEGRRALMLLAPEDSK